MKKYHFFALLSRMKLIQRWSLMRNTQPENISEHTLQVAQIAHGLALIHNRVFGGSVNAERAAVLALYHDATEIFTGDLPTPIKYYNHSIMNSYQQIEKAAGDRLLSMLPAELAEDYSSVFGSRREEDQKLWEFVKAADKLSAYIKCVEEMKAGNGEFQKAAASIRQLLEKNMLPETTYFMEHFMDSFSLSLDEQE